MAQTDAYADERLVIDRPCFSDCKCSSEESGSYAASNFYDKDVNVSIKSPLARKRQKGRLTEERERVLVSADNNVGRAG